MAELLLAFPKIPVRLILWSHVNGCTYPFLTYSFLEKFNHIMFTCKYSLENPYWDNTQRQQILRHSGIVYGMGDFEPELYKYKTDYSISENFTIGYVGTLNYSKLSPDFVNTCSKVCERIPNARFVLVGEPGQELVNDINRSDIKEHFIITGYLNDITAATDSFDVFGYPLISDNFATTENALLEAMAKALPVVALKQGTEQYIINHGETGYLANGIDEYADIMEYLYSHGSERERVGKNARNRAIADYSAFKNVNAFHEICNIVMTQNKQIIDFEDAIGEKPYEVFLNSLGKYREWFLNSLDLKYKNDTGSRGLLKKQAGFLPEILKGKTKSSVEHFHNYFPEDEVLKYWNDVIHPGTKE
jgi:glycosyltransferase involved in cell wall biosynthesis